MSEAYRKVAALSTLEPLASGCDVRSGSKLAADGPSHRPIWVPSLLVTLLSLSLLLPTGGEWHRECPAVLSVFL